MYVNVLRSVIVLVIVVILYFEMDIFDIIRILDYMSFYVVGMRKS